ncbi:uncharacterized protein LOC114670575 [Macaca mulatta]
MSGGGPRRVTEGGRTGSSPGPTRPRPLPASRRSSAPSLGPHSVPPPPRAPLGPAPSPAEPSTVAFVLLRRPGWAWVCRGQKTPGPGVRPPPLSRAQAPVCDPSRTRLGAQPGPARPVLFSPCGGNGGAGRAKECCARGAPRPGLQGLRSQRNLDPSRARLATLAAPEPASPAPGCACCPQRAVKGGSVLLDLYQASPQGQTLRRGLGCRAGLTQLTSFSTSPTNISHRVGKEGFSFSFKGKSGGGRRRWPTSLSGGGPANWPLAVALAGSRVAWTWTHVHLSQAACSCQWLSLAFPMTVAADRGDPCHQERCLGVRREFCQSQSQGWTPRAPSSAPGGRVVCLDHGPSGPALPIFIPGGSCCPALWLVPFSWCLHVQKRTEVLTNI